MSSMGFSQRLSMGKFIVVVGVFCLTSALGTVVVSGLVSSIDRYVHRPPFMTLDTKPGNLSLQYRREYALSTRDYGYGIISYTISKSSLVRQQAKSRGEAPGDFYLQISTDKSPQDFDEATKTFSPATREKWYAKEAKLFDTIVDSLSTSGSTIEPRKYTQTIDGHEAYILEYKNTPTTSMPSSLSRTVMIWDAPYAYKLQFSIFYDANSASLQQIDEVMQSIRIRGSNG